MTLLTRKKDIAGFSDEQGNRVQGAPWRFSRSSVLFAAKNCTLVLEDGVKLLGARIIFQSDNARVEIGRDSCLKNQVRCGTGSTVRIGEKLIMTGNGAMSAAEGANLTIGDHCMFGLEFDLRADHAHPIFDRRTGERLNPSRDVSIGNHVWLAPHVRVYPGASVDEGSIIGASSIVTGHVPANCIAIGAPARVTRRNVVWDWRHLCIHDPWKFDHADQIPGMWQSDLPFDDDKT